MITATPSASLETWIFALTSSASVGLASLVPWLFNMTFFEKQDSHQRGHKRIRLLLSFAVGSILGDIFLHLIPESIKIHLLEKKSSLNEAHQTVGLSIISGVILFFIVDKLIEVGLNDKYNNKNNDDEKTNNLTVKEEDKLRETLVKSTKSAHISKPQIMQYDNLTNHSNFDDNNNNEEQHSTKDATPHNQLPFLRFRKPNSTSVTSRIDQIDVNNNDNINAQINYNNHNGKQLTNSYNVTKLPTTTTATHNTSITTNTTTSKAREIIHDNTAQKPNRIESAGYLNLIANGFDNFTHGLAIGASFLAGPKVGFLTTLVVLIHEVPHEICDYAILVRSGFSRWDAVKAQSMTAIFGVLGTATALSTRSIDTLNSITFWLLPFSAGGFLHISLVNIMTEIVDQDSALKVTDLAKQLACMGSGLVVVGLLCVVAAGGKYSSC